MNDIEKLDILLESIVKLTATNDYGVNHLEWLFLEVSKILLNSTNAREYFFEKLMKNTKNIIMLEKYTEIPDGYLDSDLLAFLAHLTKWTEFKLFVIERQKWKTNISNDLAGIIKEALQSNWEDRDFYKTFINKIRPAYSGEIR